MTQQKRVDLDPHVVFIVLMQGGLHSGHRETVPWCRSPAYSWSRSSAPRGQARGISIITHKLYVILASKSCLLLYAHSLKINIIGWDMPEFIPAPATDPGLDSVKKRKLYSSHTAEY